MHYGRWWRDSQENATFYNKLCWSRPRCRALCDLDLWPFELESGVRVTCDVGYLCTKISLPRPLCSRLRPDVRDRQTDVRRHHRLMPPPRGRGIISLSGGSLELIYRAQTARCSISNSWHPSSRHPFFSVILLTKHRPRYIKLHSNDDQPHHSYNAIHITILLCILKTSNNS